MSSAATIAALGIDVGSTTAKVVGVDVRGDLVWSLLEPTDPRLEGQLGRLLASARSAAGGTPPVVATGYGRALVRDAVRHVTEVTCHARGVFRALGHGGTLVDIGGQDSKVIVVGPRGAVLHFAMNDKCAAGTGRFLEATALRLRQRVEDLAPLALAGSDEVPISSTCTVFAESEIVSMIARGTALEPIVRGLHRALVQRVASMVRSVGLAPPLLLSGGLALNGAVGALLGEELRTPVTVAPHPQLMGAYGAALLALAEPRAGAPIG